MKKGIKIFLIITTVIIIILGIDFASIILINRPIFALKRENNKYSGIFFNTYNCAEFSFPQIKSKWSKYSCATARQDLGKVVEIIDETKTIDNFTCAEALDEFYEDESYKYYYDCLKSKYVIVKYESGYEETVTNALEFETITIEDLEEYNIDYIKKDKLDVTYINIIEEKDCNGDAKLYYQKGDIKVYTYCIKTVEVTSVNKQIELKDYLDGFSDVRNGIDNITKVLNETAVIRDGGSRIYHDDGTKKYTNNNLSILACNTLDGNRDVHIGTQGIANNICMNKE